MRYGIISRPVLPRWQLLRVRGLFPGAFRYNASISAYEMGTSPVLIGLVGRSGTCAASLRPSRAITATAGHCGNCGVGSADWLRAGHNCELQN